MDPRGHRVLPHYFWECILAMNVCILLAVLALVAHVAWNLWVILGWLFTRKRPRLR